jgi:hypothetical protein
VGLLVDGVWVDQWYDTKSTGGAFVRGKAVFRSWGRGVYGGLIFCHRLGSTIFPLCRPPSHHRGCERQRVLTHCVSKSVPVCASLPSSRALIWNGRTDGNRGRQFVVGYATRALTARAGQPRVRSFSRWLHPFSRRRAKFNASHATLDPDRACSVAQDGTLSLSKAAIRLTQMIVP